MPDRFALIATLSTLVFIAGVIVIAILTHPGA